MRETVAASYTLVLHAALWLPITVLGFFYLYQQNLGWRDFSRAQEAISEESVQNGIASEKSEVVI